MASIFVAEVQVHSKPAVRKTFIGYVDSKEEFAEILNWRTPWHELIAARPIDTNEAVHELTPELMAYGKGER